MSPVTKSWHHVDGFQLCTFLFWMVLCVIWERCIVVFVNLVYSIVSKQPWGNIHTWIPGELLIDSYPLVNMAPISHTTFSNMFSWMKNFVFWFEFHWSLFLRVQLTTISTGTENGSVPNRQQAITWTSADPVPWCLYERWGQRTKHHSILSGYIPEANQ